VNLTQTHEQSAIPVLTGPNVEPCCSRAMHHYYVKPPSGTMMHRT